MSRSDDEVLAREVTDNPTRVREIVEALEKTDGSDRAALKVLTGFTDEEIDDLGGLVDEDRA